jgi:transcriptional regulator with XRE-family HTH domain
VKGVIEMSFPSGISVGDRIRTRRLQLGKSARTIAGLAGINPSTLTRIENGQNAGNNRTHLANIARALRCPIDYLTGVAIPGADKDAAQLSADSHETVRALLDADLEFPAEPDRPQPNIEALASQMIQVIQMRQDCDYARLIRLLPTMIQDLYAATAGEHRERALGMLVKVCEAASFAVRYTGQPAGAQVAADRCRQAAALTRHPVSIAFGEWARAHAALGCGLPQRAAKIAVQAVDQLDQVDAGSVSRDAMRGMLSLTAALALSSSGRPEPAGEALSMARDLAETTGETDTLSLMFGPTNVRLWQMAMLVEADDPGRAIEVATGVNLNLIASASRQSVFHLDRARALGAIGKVTEAVAAIEAAERRAPQRVHGDPLVVETVRDLLEQQRRRAVDTRLRGLCTRVGLAP